MKIRIIFLFVMAAALSFTSFSALAQDSSSDTMSYIRQRAMTDKKLLVADTMKFTEAEAKGFWPVYERYEKDQIKQMKKSIEFLDEYGKSFNTMTDKAAKKLLTDIFAIESERTKLRKAYITRFAKVLSYKRVAQFYQLENKISAIMGYDIAAKIPLAK